MAETMSTWPDGRRPVTVELRGGTWGCWACSAPARELPDMTPAVAAGNPRAHVCAVIDHDRQCPHASDRTAAAATG